MAFYLNEADTMLAAEIPPGTRQFGARLMYLKFKLEVDASAQIGDVDTALKAIMDGPTQVFPAGFTTTEEGFLTELQNRPNHFSEAFRILMRAAIGEAPARSGVADVGDIKPSLRAAAPTGWLLCDGATVLRATYQNLFDWADGEGLIGPGLLFGSGDGTTTFVLPDLRGRGFMGLDSSQTEFDAIGKMGGAKTHTLNAGEMPTHSHTGGAHTHSTPAHTHSIPEHSHEVADHQHGVPVVGSEFDHSHMVDETAVAGIPEPQDGNSGLVQTEPAGGQTTTEIPLETDNGGGGTTGAGGAVATTNAGSGEPHNNLQPYFVGNWLIKA